MTEMTQASRGFDIPKRGLTRLARKAAKAIKAIADAHEYDSGGCTTFYTPKDWADRGEQWGDDALLVVVYDGGDLHSVMSNEFGYELRNEIEQALFGLGLWLEDITGWCAGVYNDA